MDSIHITPVRENVVSKTPEQAGGYLEIVRIESRDFIELEALKAYTSKVRGRV